MAGTKYVRFPECKSGLAERNCAGAVLWLAIFTFILVIAVFLVKPAWADASSAHGPFTSSTDKCSGCHRMHDSQGAGLISQPSPTELCLSCHAKGQSADTAVLEGIYLDAQNTGHGWGTTNGTLLGGGFNYVGQTQPVTGKHVLGVTAAAYGTETGQVLTLSCVDCHTPHQGPNYRLLRQRPGGAASNVAVTWNGPWTDASQTAGGGDYAAYTDYDFSGSEGVQYYTKNYKSGISEWCAACHTHYLAVSTSGSTYNDYKNNEEYNAGDTYGLESRHRHTVNVVITGRYDPISGQEYNLTTDLPLADLSADGRTTDDLLVCLSCHRAHGSAAVMSGSASLASRGSVLPSGTDSMLLRADDRLMCKQCHDM